MAKNEKADFASKGFANHVSSTSTRQYADREVVFTQGDTADSLFRVQQGYVKLSMASTPTQKAAIAILSAGECFGEGCLNGKSCRANTATSVQRSTIDEVTKKAMTLRLKNEPALSKLFIAHLLNRLSRTEEDLVAQRVNTSERRLARLLVQLSDVTESSKIPMSIVKIDQQTLAQMVGTTRSRVSYFMNQFRKKGFISYNGSLHVNKSLLAFLQKKEDTE